MGLLDRLLGRTKKTTDGGEETRPQAATPQDTAPPSATTESASQERSMDEPSTGQSEPNP